jgi:hypothetical protein
MIKRDKILTNVSVSDLIKVDGRTVRDVMLLVSDQGGSFLDRITGEVYAFEARVCEIGDVLFEHKGPVALFVGVGRNDDGSGTVPGETTIVRRDKEFRVVFATPGFCITTIHRRSPRDRDRRYRKERRRRVPGRLIGTISDVLKPTVITNDYGFNIIELADISIRGLVKMGDELVSDSVLVNSIEGALRINRLTGDLMDLDQVDCHVSVESFERDGYLALILGYGLKDWVVPGESSIIQKDRVLKIIFALERFSVATIHHFIEDSRLIRSRSIESYP